jgi:hypothetical protein
MVRMVRMVRTLHHCFIAHGMALDVALLDVLVCGCIRCIAC